MVSCECQRANSGLRLANPISTMNKNRNRKNQPPTVVGKRQPRNAKPKLAKRSEVVQAARNHPELNLLTGDDEFAYRETPARRSKAGR